MHRALRDDPDPAVALVVRNRHDSAEGRDAIARLARFSEALRRGLLWHRSP